MNNNRAAEILALIERLKSDINLAGRHSLGSTVQLLRMALLDLQMIAHSISDEELRCLTQALESDPQQTAGNGHVLLKNDTAN
jgi:hypothetical protein